MPLFSDTVYELLALVTFYLIHMLACVLTCFSLNEYRLNRYRSIDRLTLGYRTSFIDLPD